MEKHTFGEQRPEDRNESKRKDSDDGGGTGKKDLETLGVENRRSRRAFPPFDHIFIIVLTYGYLWTFASLALLSFVRHAEE